MLKIKLVVLGKLKEHYLQSAEQEYLKRVSPFAEINIQELREEPFKDKSDREQIKTKEAEKVLAVIDKLKNPFVIALDEHGDRYSSMDFAKKIESWGSQELVFVIGGPLGLSEDVKRRANLVLSFSTMTFTHQMIRIFLLEQLYRAITIIQGKRYHY